MKKTFFLPILIAAAFFLVADEGEVCRNGGKIYDSDGQFLSSDFVAGGNGLLFDSTIHPNFGAEIDLENIVFPSDQPFFVDYIGEGAGASHTFGFFFLDIDTNRNGIPNFFETNPTDDMDGDGIRNSEDTDDDGDGIPDDMDNMAHAGYEVSATGSLGSRRIVVSGTIDPGFYRNGAEAAAAGEHANDFWQWIPSNAVSYGGKWIFAHPGAFLYVDNDMDQTPDILEPPGDTTGMPCYAVDKDHDRNADRVRYGADKFPALLGNWSVAVGSENLVYWLGSTIFKLCDDGVNGGVHTYYQNYSPYSPIYTGSNNNAQPDYLIYDTADVNSPLIPDEVKGLDPEGVPYWKYRWYESDISGGRELCFFLTVFYGSGGRSVNTYFSKTAWNPDPGATNKPTSKGVKYGLPDPALYGAPMGVQTPDNWYPTYRSEADHNRVAQYAWGLNWGDIATMPTDGSSPIAIAGHGDKQAWIDMWQNYAPANWVINYIGLGRWLDSTGGANLAEGKILSRYGIDISLETDNSIIRKSNGNMNHMMVGAPEAETDAWLLGWEDLFSGGDRDYEDVVFYVKREAKGSAQSLNVAGDLDRFEDVSIATVEFEFEDNFTSDLWGVEGNFINYFYRLSSLDDWIPLLGGEHTATPNQFTENTENGGTVRRHVVLHLADEGSRELYWKVEMNSNDVTQFEPEVSFASVDYTALLHEVFYNGGVIPNSNVDYYGAYETPRISWKEKNINRGHLYARKMFTHGNPLEVVSVDGSNDNPENHLTGAPPAPWLWDAGFSMLGQLTDVVSTRKIYTFTSNSSGDFLNDADITEREFKVGMDNEVRIGMALDPTRVDGVIQDNFHDPGGDFDLELASDWLAAWVHGHQGSVGSVAGYKREWVLGGLNRASPAIIRAPGYPSWMDGSAIDNDIKQTYWDYMDDNSETPTRILIGSESGMVHLINAGNWRGKKKDDADIWADGHYLNDDFGDGTEQWAIIPRNLLDDLKSNKNGGNSIAARVDNTAIVTTIRYNHQWRRVAIISQGEDGGAGNGNRGNYVWAMDLTEVDNKPPKILWERTSPNYNQILGQMAMGWAKQDQNGNDFGGEGIWIAVYTSGASSVVGHQGTVEVVNVYTGELVKRINLGPGVVMAGTPALADVNQDGYIDWLYGTTSDGKLLAFSLEDYATRSTMDFSSRGARFFLSPNVYNYSDTEMNVVTVTGDNPLLVDENLGPAKNFVVSVRHDAASNTWTQLALFELETGHKAFSRPLLMGDSLLLGTTTGETFDYCDYNPDDPGMLYLFRNITDFTDNDSIDNFGTTKAPITGGGRVHVHRSVVAANANWNDPGTPVGILTPPEFALPPKSLKANIFTPLGYEEIIIGEGF